MTKIYELGAPDSNLWLSAHSSRWGLGSIGIPVPGEPVLLLGAALAASDGLNIFLVILFATLGEIMSAQVSYWLTRRYGQAVISRYMHVEANKLARAETFFARYGPKAIFFVRLIPVLRMFTGVLAGTNHLPIWGFTLYNSLASVIWITAMSSLGYFFGQNLRLIESWMRQVGAAAVVIVLLGLLIFWLNRRWRRSEQVFRYSSLGAMFVLFRGMWWRAVAGGRRGLLVYLSALLASGWLMSALVDDWLDKDPDLYRLDQALTPWLKSGLTEAPWWLEGLAWLGDVRFLLGLGLIFTLWQFYRGKGSIAGLTLLTVLGALALGWVLQMWLKRPLPASVEPYWRLTDYAFPHLSSLMSVALYGWLAHLWGQSRSWSSQVNAGTLTVFLVFSLGVVALFLGQAHLSDVIAGLALGFFWLGLPLGLLHWPRSLQFRS